MPAERRRRFLSTLGHLALSRFLLPLAIDIAMLLLSVFCLALCGAFFPAYSVARAAERDREVFRIPTPTIPSRALADFCDKLRGWCICTGRCTNAASKHQNSSDRMPHS